MKHTVIYNHFSKWPHTGIILAGCRMLEKQGLIDFTFHNRVGDPSFPSEEICGCELIIDGVKVYFDCFDGYAHPDLMKEHLKKYKYYFMRSFSKVENEKFGEDGNHIYSLGLNYQVYAKSSDRNLFNTQSGGSIVRRLMNTVFGWWQRPASFARRATKVKGQPKICFMTRLWESARDEEEKEHINSDRIELIRRIKAAYPSHSYVGVFDNELARELCPDLILNKWTSVQPMYLKIMHSADICIGTMGLHRSIGWKTAEYVAASKAILHEKMYYSPPGNFENGTHYLEFSTVDECMKLLSDLVDNPDKIWQLKKENEAYYKHYVSPDRQVLNAIELVKTMENQ